MDPTLQSPAEDRMIARGTLPRAWDDFDAYLFDVDGTLLNCRDAVHYFAFCDGVESALWPRAQPRRRYGPRQYRHRHFARRIDSRRRSGIRLAPSPRRGLQFNVFSCRKESSEDQHRRSPGTREVLQHLRDRKAITRHRYRKPRGNRHGSSSKSADLLRCFDFRALATALETGPTSTIAPLVQARDSRRSECCHLRIGDTPCRCSRRPHHASASSLSLRAYTRAISFLLNIQTCAFRRFPRSFFSARRVPVAATHDLLEFIARCAAVCSESMRSRAFKPIRFLSSSGIVRMICATSYASFGSSTSWFGVRKLSSPVQ